MVHTVSILWWSESNRHPLSDVTLKKCSILFKTMCVFRTLIGCKLAVVRMIALNISCNCISHNYLVRARMDFLISLF